MKPLVLVLASACRYLKRASHAELSLILGLAHMVAWLCGVAAMSPPDPEFGEWLDEIYDSGGGASVTMFAGRPFHFTYENILLKVIFLADLPGALAAIPVSLILVPLLSHLSTYESSYVGAGFILSFATVQWMMIGLWIQTRNEKAGGSCWLGFTKRHCRAILVTLLLAGVIAVPLIQLRSDALAGIRHNSMSFQHGR
jgi:hypothetical protein